MLPCWQGRAGFSRRKWKRIRQKKERFNLSLEVSEIGGGMAQWTESFPEKPEDCVVRVSSIQVNSRQLPAIPTQKKQGERICPASWALDQLNGQALGSAKDPASVNMVGVMDINLWLPCVLTCM